MSRSAVATLAVLVLVMAGCQTASTFTAVATATPRASQVLCQPSEPDCIGPLAPGMHASASLLTPVRYGDAATDLWTTFNVVQEHLIRGGDRYMGYTAGMGIRRNRTRPVGGLGESQKLNKALWSLASEFANN